MMVADAFSYIDDGGLYVVSQLYALKEMMYRIQYEEKLDEEPRPCERFDLMGGSGTGGSVMP